MAIWIDPPRWSAHGRLWSHLISDTSLDELHTFAARVGIPARGFDGDHFDVPQERYAALVAAGARPAEGKELARLLRDSGLRFQKRQGERSLDEGPAGRWPNRRNYVACFATVLEDVTPPVAPRDADVDAAEWVHWPEVERRCSGEFWWPLLASLVTRADGSARGRG